MDGRLFLEEEKVLSIFPIQLFSPQNELLVTITKDGNNILLISRSSVIQRKTV